jgi:hypothetical protein
MSRHQSKLMEMRDREAECLTEWGEFVAARVDAPNITDISLRLIPPMARYWQSDGTGS